MAPVESLSSGTKGKGKGQLKVASQTVQSPAVPKLNLNPDEQLKAAQARVVKLEAAIVAIGDEAAAACLMEALAKARVHAQLRPVQDRVAHTEAFLDRSRKKMERRSFQNPGSDGGIKNKDSGRCGPVGGSADRSQGTNKHIHCTFRSSGGDSFVESKNRQDGRLHGGQHPGGCVKESQVVCLHFLWSWCRVAEVDVEFLPMCDEDVVHWMQDGQADMQEATLAGNPHEVARLCHVMGTAAASWATVTMPFSTVSNAVQP